MDPRGRRWAPPWLPVFFAPRPRRAPHELYFCRAEKVREAILHSNASPPKPVIKGMINYYIHSHQMQQNARALCEAIIAAVNYKMTHLLQVLEVEVVQSAFSESLLYEIIQNRSSLSKHIQFLVMDVFHHVGLNCSEIKLSDLLRKNIIGNKPLLLYLCKRGLKIHEDDFDWIVSRLPDDESTSQALEVILSHYTQLKPGVLNRPCQAAMESKKKMLGLCFMKYGAVAITDPKEIATKLIQEGNSFSAVGSYQDALDKYNCALVLCHKNNIEDFMASIHVDCCQACLKLNQHKEAYEHADQGVRLNPDLEMGYFQRAEALCMLLRSDSRNPFSLSYANVVADYCQSQRLKSNLTALCKAIVIGVDQNSSEVILQPPTIFNMEDKVCFCNKLLEKLVSHPSCKQQHLEFYVLKMLSGINFSASSISLSQVLHVPVNNVELIHRLIECHVVIKATDVLTAVKVLQDNEVDTYKLIVHASAAEAAHISNCCQIAVKAKKVEMAVFLLEHGANPSVLSYEFICHAIEKDKWSIRDELLVAIKCSRGTKGYSREPSIDKYCRIAAEAKNVDMVVCLLEHGANPSTISYKFVCYVLKNGKGSICDELLVTVRPNIDKYCEIASETKNVEMVVCLLDLGANPSVVSIELVCHALEMGQISTCDKIWKAIKPTFNPRNVNICTLISSTCKLADHPNFLREFLDAGVDPNGSHNKKSLIQVLGLTYLTHIQRNTLVSVLLEKGADCQQLCLTGKASTTTPLHTVTRLALEAGGDTSVLDALVAHPTYKLPTNNGKVVDGDNKTPFHLAVQGQKYEASIAVLECLIEKHKLLINPFVKDRKGKQARDYIPKKDKPRVALLAKAEKNFPSPTKSDRRGKAKEESLPKKQNTVTKMDATLLVQHSVIAGACSSSGVHFTLEQTDARDLELDPKIKPYRTTEQAPDLSIPSSATTSDHGVDSTSKLSDMNELFLHYGLGDDDLLWKVEITAKVVKFFNDVKRVSETDRISALRTIHQLAKGRRGPNLAKPVSGVSGLNLYRAEMSKSGRIIWEKAVRLSSQRSGSRDIPVCSQVICILEIVLAHKQMKRRIEQKASIFTHGQILPVQYSLLPQYHDHESSSSEAVRGRESLEIPKIYILHEDSAQHTTLNPTAGIKEDVHDTTHLYYFPCALVKRILIGPQRWSDVEFPFKVWHDIITLDSKESILLLGRSGTGKTTCTLYRLWNEFKCYWDPDMRDPDAKLPRRPLLPIDAIEEPLLGEITEEGTQTSDTSARSQITDISSDEWVPEQYENLHQVFVTKNRDLCAQVKKQFFELASAHEYLRKHTEYQNRQRASDDMQNSLSKVPDFEYPLFLTARQFYILLDNSLHDGRNFFHYSSDGSLEDEIVTTNYDIDDLEESAKELDNESAIFKRKQPCRHEAPTKWIEVTSLYFTECVWPDIKYKHKKDFDPLLVWTEIQSFIKGSERALRKGYPLTLEEYVEVGKKMAPNFSSKQKIHIHELFCCYQGYCQEARNQGCVRLFDVCDLIQNLYNRLCELKDVSWSIHCFFIDEVQDFTQAELTIFLHSCRDPNSLFFTGDVAQSINAFRFQDLYTLFHNVHRNVPSVKKPKKPPYTLTKNFRCQSGVLRLAGSIIHLLSNFFPYLIDNCLLEDKAMFPGPTPIFILSCEVEDIPFLLSSSRQESAIEFGAHQVILVRSQEAKNKLPKRFQGAIVLTISEAKGLEFNDVLLYNFFKDSPIDGKLWRVVLSYFKNPSCVEIRSKIPDIAEEPRSLEFDRSRHASLSIELKYLYIAITRAKCNLWIYDSHKENCLPMFTYWYKCGLIEVVSTQESQTQINHTFTTSSTEDEWKVQGDLLKKRSLWEQAWHCYLKAGAEQVYLAREAEAFLLVEQARQHSLSEKYQEAAACFLECDNAHHDVNYIKWAACCLLNTQPPRYSEAAKLYERLGERARALKAFRKANDAESCARLLEEDKKYSESVRILHLFCKELDALAKAANFEKQGIELDQDVQVSQLSYSYAKMFAQNKDESMLCAILEYMSEIPLRVRLYKECGLHKKAFEVYECQKQTKEAFHLAVAQMAVCHVDELKHPKADKTMTSKAWFCKAIALAESDRDDRMKAVIIIQRIKLDFKELCRRKSLYDCDEITQLYTYMHLTKDQEHYAHVNLILGRLLKKITLLRTAKRSYNLQENKIGELEAFHFMIEQDTKMKESVKTVLDMCHCAADTYKLLQNADSSVRACQAMIQAETFFNLQKVGDSYFTLPGQDEWLDYPFMCCKVKGKDRNGMLKLDVLDIQNELLNRYKDFEINWFIHFSKDLLSQISNEFALFGPHKELQSKRALSHVYSINSSEVKDYITTCIHECELAEICGRRIRDGTVKLDVIPCLLHILTIFSPQVAFFLPLRKEHVLLVRGSQCLNKLFRKWISGLLKEAEKRDRECFDMNLWLLIWRVACLIDGSMVTVHKSLAQQADIINSDRGELHTEPEQTKLPTTPSSESSNGRQVKSLSESSQPRLLETHAAEHKVDLLQDQPPPAFHYWIGNNKYRHLFFYWLVACDFMKKGQASYSSRCAVKYFFLGGNRRNISVMNIVNIFALHSTSLLAILTHINHLNGVQRQFCVPFLYKHVVNLFDFLSTHTEEDRSAMVACAEEVVANPECHVKLAVNCEHILRTMLDILLGYRCHVHILARAFKSEDAIKSGAACSCLILTLTIFGNLILISYKHQANSKLNLYSMDEYQQRICIILRKVVAGCKCEQDFVHETLTTIVKKNYSSNIFPLITSLLRQKDEIGTLAYLQLNTSERDCHVCFVKSKDCHGLARAWNHKGVTGFTDFHEQLPVTVGPGAELTDKHSQTVSASECTPHVSFTQSLCSSSQHTLRSDMFVSVDKSQSQQLHKEPEDDDFNDALSLTQISKQAPAVALDVTDKDFCYVCSIPLLYEGTPHEQNKADEQAQPRACPVPPVNELYSDHIKSEDHIRNEILYYKSRKHLELYNSQMHEVEKMLLKCRDLEKTQLSLILFRLVDDMEEQREVNEKAVHEYNQRHAYAELISQTDTMCDVMCSWLLKAEDECRSIKKLIRQKQDLDCQFKPAKEEKERHQSSGAGQSETFAEGAKMAM